MLCHVFWSQVEYKIVCFISVESTATNFSLVTVLVLVVLTRKRFAHHAILKEFSTRSPSSEETVASNTSMSHSSYLVKSLMFA